MLRHAGTAPLAPAARSKGCRWFRAPAPFAVRNQGGDGIGVRERLAPARRAHAEGDTMTHLRGPAGRLARALTIALLLAGAVTASGPAGASVAACGSWTGAQPPSPSTMNNVLDSVVVLTPCDAWAVGYDTGSSGLNQTLTEHWDGSAWTVVPSPDVAGLGNVLNGVRAVSAADVWAVGASAAPGVEQTLILHWDGHTWQQVTSPNPGTRAGLGAVRTVSATDAWAVGSFSNGNAGQPLILHWDGQKWAQVTSPHPGTGGALSGVAATSASNAWAAGTYFNGTAEQGFILHWNGQKWATQTIPNPGGTAHDTSLNAVAANGAGGKAWAVGFYTNGTSDKTLILAWTGTKWAQQPSPTPGNGAFLDGAATTAAGNAWAVGSSNNGTTSVVLHWNGTTWAQEASPNPGPETGLFAVAASSASNAWAVGRFVNGSDLDQNLAIHCC